MLAEEPVIIASREGEIVDCMLSLTVSKKKVLWTLSQFSR